MKISVFGAILILGLYCCSKATQYTGDLNNKTGSIEIHRCFCDPSAYRYLIAIYENNDTIYYNPVNLSEEYKDKDYIIVFTANLLNDSSIVYTNLANDALVENFKVRNITLVEISKSGN